MTELPIVSSEGYQVLIALKNRRPQLFITPDAEKLKVEMTTIFKGDADKLWSRPLELRSSLAPINENPQGGPTNDAANALTLIEALPANIGAQSLHSERLWASVNCFGLAPWVPVRWSTGRTKRTKDQDFVHRHWLNANTEGRESNAAMRLFTLNLLASRSAEFSVYTREQLLEAMASKVNLFHRTLRYPYLAAHSKLLAYIWEEAMRDLNSRAVNHTPTAGIWLTKINERGGAVDLGTMSDDRLQNVVLEAKPNPKAP